MRYERLDTCYNCRRLYDNSVNELFCSHCVTEMSVKIDEINKFIANNRRMTMLEVSMKFDIRLELLRILKKKKMLFTGSCSRCGKKIDSGTMCSDCKGVQIIALSSMVFEKPKAEPEIGKIHFLGSRSNDN